MVGESKKKNHIRPAEEDALKQIRILHKCDERESKRRKKKVVETEDDDDDDEEAANWMV